MGCLVAPLAGPSFRNTRVARVAPGITPRSSVFAFATRSTAGGYGARVPPDPIPNSEVKPRCADGTAGATRWESTAPPAHSISNARSIHLNRAGVAVSVRRGPPRPGPACPGRIPRGGRRPPPRRLARLSLPRCAGEGLRRCARRAGRRDQRGTEGVRRLSAGTCSLSRSRWARAAPARRAVSGGCKSDTSGG